MRYLSVCSGIEAATVAWHPLGWQAAAYSEIEAFPRAVLAHHYPSVPLHGDFTTIRGDEYGPVHLLVGGTPCQDFSVAGLRAGIAGERGNLTLEFLRLASRVEPRWIVWENVPGVLSSDGGRALGAFLGGLAELGYGFAYRVLDAQHFGLAQRRARVFVVGYLGDWRRAAAVLFERESLLGHPAPRREARKGTAASVIKGAAIGRQPHNGPQYGDTIDDGSCYTLTTNEVHAVANLAPTISARTKGGGGLGTDFDCDGGLIAAPVAGVLNTSIARGTGGANEADFLITHSLRADGFDASEDGTGRGTPLVPISFQSNASGDNLSPGHDIAGTLKHGAGSGWCNAPAVAFNITPSNSNKDYNARASDRAQAVTSGGNRPSARGGDLIAGNAVRRLTPRECERLQGFPDDYTLVTYRGKSAADGPRYKALGNSMAVPVMAWIGRRIAAVEAAVAAKNPAQSRGTQI